MNVLQDLAWLHFAHRGVVSMIFVCLLLYSFILISNRQLNNTIFTTPDLLQDVGCGFPFQE